MAGLADGALYYYLQQRVFPGDRLNVGAFGPARQLRDRLPVVQIPGRHNPRSLATGGLANWEQAGPPSIGKGGGTGRINGVAIDPGNPSTLYAAAASGGLWKSVDNGGSWVPLTDNQPDLAMSCVAVDPFDSNTVYAGTGDYDGGDGAAFGLLKSSDGGQTWSIKGANVFGGNPIHRITIDPNTPNKLFACASGAGLFLSTDAGETWTMVIGPTALPGAPAVSGSFSNVVYNSTGTVIYASADNAGIYTSSDGGLTWIAMPGAPSGTGRFDVATSPRFSPYGQRTLYVLSGGAGSSSRITATAGTIYIGTPPPDDVHKAIAFTALANFPKGGGPWVQKWYDFYIGVTHQTLTYTNDTTADVDVLYVGLVDLWQSPDAGQQWQTVPGIHTDHHAIAVNPTDASQVLIGEDGGVFNIQYTQTAKEPLKIPTPVPTGPFGTFNVNAINNQLAVVQFYSGAYHPTDSTILLGGTQDNGTQASFQNLTAWYDVVGGDGGACGIDWAQPNVQWGSVYNLRFLDDLNLPVYPFARTTDDWNSSGDMTLYTGDDVEPFLLVGRINSADPNQYYTGTNYLYNHTEGLPSGSPNWTKYRQRFSNTGYVLAIANAPTDARYIYVGTSDGTLWVSKNAGTTWGRIDRQGVAGGLPLRAITGIAVSPLNPNKVFVTVSGTGSSHVWLCNNITNPTWSSIGGEAGGAPFPDIYTNCLCVLPRNSDNELMVGTDVGVFYTNDGGNHWSNATAPLHLPNVNVRDLTYMPQTSYVMATTYGRGMWRLPLPIQVVVGALLVTPNPIVGGYTANATVTVNGVAPAGGVVITLNSSNPNVASLPKRVIIPEGQTHATFVVPTYYVAKDTPVTLTASANGGSVSTTLTVQHPVLNSLTLTPNDVVGGTVSTGVVTLSGPTPGGVVVQLSSTYASIASLPATVTIPANRNSARFLVSTKEISQDTQVTIRASANGINLSGKLLIESPKLVSLSLAPATIQSGGISIATVRLDAPALRGGAYVILKSSSGSVTVPFQVAIPAGRTAVQFRIHAGVVTASTNVALTATYNGSTATNTLTVTP